MVLGYLYGTVNTTTGVAYSVAQQCLLLYLFIELIKISAELIQWSLLLWTVKIDGTKRYKKTQRSTILIIMVLHKFKDQERRLSTYCRRHCILYTVGKHLLYMFAPFFIFHNLYILFYSRISYMYSTVKTYPISPPPLSKANWFWGIGSEGSEGCAQRVTKKNRTDALLEIPLQ